MVAVVVAVAAISKLVDPAESLTAFAALLGAAGMASAVGPSVFLAVVVGFEAVAVGIILTHAGLRPMLWVLTGFFTLGFGIQIYLHQYAGISSCGCFAGLADGLLWPGLLRNACLAGLSIAAVRAMGKVSDHE